MTNECATSLYREKEAIDTNTPGERLQELAHISLELARLVATNPAAPPQLLQELANSRDIVIRKNVTANPNTPSQLLLKLGAELTGDLLNNPIFSLLLLENPNFIDEIPQYTLMLLLTHTSVPEFLFKMVSRDIRLAVSRDAKVSAQALELLAQDEDRDIRCHVASHPNTPVQVLELLAQDGDRDIRCCVTRHPKASAQTLERLAKIFRYDKDIGFAITRHPNASAQTLERLAKQFPQEVRLEVARYPKTPIPVLKWLAQDRNRLVRFCVAKNPNTSTKVLKQLAEDSDRDICKSAIFNLISRKK